MKRFWALGCIVVVWLIFSAPYFIKGTIPFPSDYLVTFFPPWNSEYGMPVKNNAMPDVITQIFPWKKLTIETWKNGQIPLWNPYSFSGTAHAANYQSAVFSPVNLLFFVFPFLSAWSLMVLLQPLVAAVGMYLFLRRFGRSQVGAVIASIAFMFCNFMTTWMAYGTLGWAIAFLPWALWATVVRARALLAISIAFSFLSGHFQISLYVLATIFAFILYLRKFNLLWYVLLGLLLASPQLFLGFDAYLSSTRSSGIGKIEVIPWQYLITIFAPDFFGNSVTRNDWFGHYAEWGSFVGVVPLLLGILALIKRSKDGRSFFIFLSIFSILLAFASPINDLIYALKLPVLSTSASSRIIVLFSLALSVLAAFGFDDWKSRKKSFVWFVIWGCVGLIVLWVFLLAGQAFPVDKLAIARRNSILPTAIAIVSLLFMLLGKVRKKFMREIVIVTLLILVVFDSLRFVIKWMPVGAREYMYPEVESMTFLKTHIGYDRVFGNIGNEAAGVFKLPIIEGYDAMYQGRYAEFINAAETGIAAHGGRSVVQFGKHGKFKTDVLKLLGVRYIYHRLSDGRNSWAFPFWEYQESGDMKIIFNDQKYQVFEFLKAYPRAFLASSYRVADDQNILGMLFDEDFDSRETLVLEEVPALEPSLGEGIAEITSYTPTSVTIQTKSDVAKLLFLSDVFDPGWHVRVDGKSAKIYRADYDFRAVALEAGKHTVQFYYFPRKLFFGLWQKD